ncbi:Rho GTPase-activating protein 30 [Anabarilius grahami]|uniref:Rho GTPase-activating protein 30 n=1 Tax=Anabarilius grahami TaxID=495550 RepID=A0A3N0YYV3_ANAGA|nr:Rho GTPase-activating protein 30 [Anabarilius grahami]
MRRGRKKGGNRDKVFGCDLLEHLTSTAQDIPQVLRSCGEFIEEHGIVDGIYRLSGVSSNTQKLRSEFDTEGSPDLNKEVYLQDIHCVSSLCKAYFRELPNPLLTYELYDRFAARGTQITPVSSEFDTEGSPDLNKEVYLQDIHCVSSLCKAYFRELPNPLLTYELYDRFADAVAVQLEDERLVKIKEVLKDLPVPHYRTLEYLMRHLVKMSTFASETNMHARNLAIVWAPNLLRSKDIESTGFNGTAAFMEVRVQSIVVEFILTHVAEVFTGTGLTVERRKSLPSPSILSSQDDHFFKSLPLHCPGNLSPGDGPPAMRSYHAIIDGTDKRKNSLKGRKWKSIFNLGGRLHDPRKKNKYSPKDKEKTTLRPAKSMDSLSCGPLALEDSKHPPAHLPPLVLSTSSGSSEGVASAGGGVSSGYAVTYRRTGGAQVSMVSGGTPGTYNRLESGGGANGAEGASQGVSRSPGMTSKADRRAGIHISGPFSVTVPLHITSGLALGVLHGGWNEKEQTLQGDAEEAGEDEDVKSTDESSQSKNGDVHESTISSCLENQVDGGKDMVEIPEQEKSVPEEGDKEAEKEDQSRNQESVKEKQEEASTPEVKEENADEDYMEMKGNLQPAPVSTLYYEDMEVPDQDLPMDLQEAFGFLDLMDSCASNQVEFSVEAPCFENEYEEEEDQNKDNQAVSCPLQNCTNDFEAPAAKISSPSFTHRPVAGKSHSLPYKSRPFLPALSLSSDDDYSPAEDDDEDDESDKGSEYEDMFCHSLPSTRCFQGLSWSAPQTTADSDADVHCSNQSECLDEMQNENNKDADQSEDEIPTAPALTGKSEEHLSSEVLKTDENKKEEDAENDKHTLIREDEAESEASGEDTYFGPDSIPSSPDPKQTETFSVAELPGAEDQQVLDDDGYHGNSEAMLTDELTAVDCISSAPPDQPPEEQTAIISERMIEEEPSEVEEDGKIEELKECENNINKTDTEEEKCEDVEEDAKTGSAEECSDEKEVSMTEGKIEGNSGEDEEDPAKEGEQDERKEDKVENSGECEEKEESAKDEPAKEGEQAERKEDLVENSGECEEEDGEEAERKEDLVENSGECEEEDGEEAERKEDLAENRGECEEEDGEQAERKEDLAENSGECEEEEESAKEEPAKEGEQAERKEDLVENSGECEEEDGEQAERKEDLAENSGECEEEEESAKDEPAKEGEQAERKEDLAENSGECEEEDGEEAEIKEGSVESDGGNTEEDVRVKTEGGNVEEIVEGKDSRDEEADEIQEHKEPEEISDHILSTAPKPSPRKMVNQMKAVPVVPPKPRNSKLTAFRKQFEHKHTQPTDAACVETDEEVPRDALEECEKQEEEGSRESHGTGDGVVDRRKDLHREAEKEVKRNSGISMCFDEAVARATVKRSRERENTERLSGTHWDSRKDGKTD